MKQSRMNRLIKLSMMIIILTCLTALFFCDRRHPTYSVIPKPAFIQEKESSFEITQAFCVAIEKSDSEVRNVGLYFTDRLNRASGLGIPVIEGSKEDISENALLLRLEPDTEGLGKEGYELDIHPDHIVLTARSPAGLFYGIQTIFQLLPVDVYSDSSASQNGPWDLPCVTIRDVPRYQYRGMHLDVCRHFFPKSFIKKYIDLLALHKFNKFHWHLTEDQGWRIEIKKYPGLTEKGAYRKETLVGHSRSKPHVFDGTPHGGYYTQDDIREIVAYARDRYVTVIPEIEMPGHATAALAVYPELSCTGGPFEVATQWGVFEDVYCAGNDRVFEFLEDVLTEVIDLFPGTYVHVGGDECPKVRWEVCEKCQARIEAEGLKDEDELQSYFIRRIETFLSSRGRRLIGWDEILEGGLAPEATVMSWRGMEGGIEAAQQGHDVIMTPISHCYFDYYQADPQDEPLAIGGKITLKDVYTFEPTPASLTPVQAEHILGAQGNVWTEYIETPEHVEYMSVPRMCALAEVVWSSREVRNWKDFKARLNAHVHRLDKLGVNYRKESK